MVSILARVTGCSSMVEYRPWKAGAAGSSPATQTTNGETHELLPLEFR